MHLQLLRNLSYVQQIHILCYLQRVIQETLASSHAFGLKGHEFERFYSRQPNIIILDILSNVQQCRRDTALNERRKQPY